MMINKLKCLKYHLMISRQIDNDLNSTEESSLNNHLSICPLCRNKKNELISVNNIIIFKTRPVINTQLYEDKKSSLYKINFNIFKIVPTAIILLLIFSFSFYFIYNNNAEIIADFNVADFPLGDYFYNDTDSNTLLSSYDNVEDDELMGTYFSIVGF